MVKDLKRDLSYLVTKGKAYSLLLRTNIGHEFGAKAV